MNSPFNPTRRTVLRAASLAVLAPGLAACRFDGDAVLPATPRVVATLEHGRAVANVNYANTIAASRKAIGEALQAARVASAALAFIDGESIVWSETFGYVDAARQTLPTATTLYGIGSVSKMFAAVATMILVDRGLVGLDVPIVEYLPGFAMASPEYRQITSRMLLSHCSGLPGTHARNAFGFAPNTGYLEQLLAALRHSTLKHTPGELAVYCNDGFTVIEGVIAAASGKPYPRFVADEILTPLGMLDSRYALSVLPPGAQAPAFNDDGPMPAEYGQVYASGGLYSTPNDMARFAMMLMNGGRLGDVRILSAQAVAEMGSNQTGRLTFHPFPTFTWGLGWDQARHPAFSAVGVEAWQKNGGTLEYGTDLFVLPKERLAVLLTATSSGFKTGKLAEALLLNALVERGSLPAYPTALSNVPPPVAADPGELGALAGSYAKSGEVLRFVAQSDGSLKLLRIDSDGTQEITAGLTRRSDGYFAGDATSVSYARFVHDGRDYVAARLNAGHYRLTYPYAQRLTPRAPLSPAWQARIGRRWLVADDAPSSIAITTQSPLLRLAALDDLPGYLFVDGVSGFQVVDASQSDSAARMFLKIPGDSGRDLSDLIVETRQINGRDEEWLHWNGNLYRPLESVPVPDYFIKLDGEGNCEWRRIAQATTLNIATSGDWRLYDKDFTSIASGSGSVRGLQAPANAWLRIFGEPYSVAWLS